MVVARGWREGRMGVTILQDEKNSGNGDGCTRVRLLNATEKKFRW